jgi:hypothetical protein
MMADEFQDGMVSEKESESWRKNSVLMIGENGDHRERPTKPKPTTPVISFSPPINILTYH